ncbi:MAG TPA: hypothetical protein VNZ52_02025 [Candidatus Thermoplasmatota archaeon]|nr:hypothetical protein [Candidatus Thermoplasmatota archaeon]
MRRGQGGDFFAQISLEGEIAIKLPSGHAFELTGVDITASGGFLNPSAPVHMEVRGLLGELRKLAQADPHLEAFLEVVKEEPDAAKAVFRLTASPDLMTDFAMVLAGRTEEPQAEELLENEAWITHALSFGRYLPEEVGIVTHERHG